MSQKLAADCDCGEFFTFSDKLECTCSRDCHTQPRVHTVSQEELMVLSSCITRWRTNVREDMHRYEKSASSFRADIQQAYDQRHLQQVSTVCTELTRCDHIVSVAPEFRVKPS